MVSVPGVWQAKTAQYGRRGLVVGTALLLVVAGCRSSKGPTANRVGGDLPTTSRNSVALPEATDAADAPNAPQVVESRDASLTTFRDPATGVSFQYPTVWRPSQGAVLAAPEFSEVAGAPRITEEFSPKGNVYEPTVLRALMFSYGAKQGLDAAGCAALPGKVAEMVGSPKPVTYNGVSYMEAGGSDAGMCTHVQSRIDSTLHGGQCLVFERDFVTSCPFVKSATLPRPLTPAESAALQRHLDAVMASVQLAPATAAK